MTTNAAAGLLLEPGGRPGTENLPLEQTVNHTDPTADVRVAEARRAVHESLILLPAWEADRVRSLIADLETAVEFRAASAVVSPPTSRAAVLREGAAAIEAEQAREEATEWARFGELDHETEIGRGYVLAAAALLRRLAAEAQQQECPASISGHCLAEAQSETACDTDAGECVHGGRPAAEAQQQPGEDVVEAHRRALSEALHLGNGAPWQAILDRAGDLSRRDVEAQQQTDCDHDSQVIDHEGAQFWACLKCGTNLGRVEAVQQPAAADDEETHRG